METTLIVPPIVLVTSPQTVPAAAVFASVAFSEVSSSVASSDGEGSSSLVAVSEGEVGASLSDVPSEL